MRAGVPPAPLDVLAYCRKLNKRFKKAGAWSFELAAVGCKGVTFILFSEVGRAVMSRSCSLGLINPPEAPLSADGRASLREENTETHEVFRMERAQMKSHASAKGAIPRQPKREGSAPELSSLPEVFSKKLGLSLNGMPKAVFERHHEFAAGPVHVMPFQEGIQGFLMGAGSYHQARVNAMCKRIMRSW